MEYDLKQLIKEREQTHLNMDVRKSNEKLDEILADEFWEIGSSGITIDKRECLESGVHLIEMTMHHFEAEQLADDVVLTTYLIETKHRNTLRSSIWKRIDGRWQLFFHQGTITSLQPHEGISRSGDIR
ncbi:DUF4440 domain-containing protein [Halobacillus campisalis]|uniref:DUF4440 domain-containing protein n=1 Tax=Halobacillus campisalis TaxID=435909 RepID=A0ABW2K6A4_9BACI|nr:DUF4440 domain-containing protein [Halobacillus campisalis]